MKEDYTLKEFKEELTKTKLLDGFSFVMILNTNEYDKIKNSLRDLPMNIEVIILLNEIGEFDLQPIQLPELKKENNINVKRYKVVRKELDFSYLRNLAKSYASREWIISIDSDEIFSWTYDELIQINNLDSSIYGVLADVVYKVYDVTNEKHIIQNSTQCKIFRNRASINWANAVHEDILTSIENAKKSVINSNLMFRHLGYNEDENAIQSKIERNKSIIERELEKDPENEFYIKQLNRIQGN